MKYYIEKETGYVFDEAVDKVSQGLKTVGFGVLTDIDIQQKLKEKLGVDFGKYRILGACHPPSAHRALQVEPMIGTMLPCNVVVRETEDRGVVVAAINPVTSMLAVENPDLALIANDMREKLKDVITAVANIFSPVLFFGLLPVIHGVDNGGHNEIIFGQTTGLVGGQFNAHLFVG